jgi:hypothetical protein
MLVHHTLVFALFVTRMGTLWVCGLDNWTQNPTQLRVGSGRVMGSAGFGEVYL